MSCTGAHYLHNPKLPQRLQRIGIPTHFIWVVDLLNCDEEWTREYVQV